MNNAVFGKTMENVKKNMEILNWSQQVSELFSIRTKLPCYKMFHGKFIRNRNGKNSNINQ